MGFNLYEKEEFWVKLKRVIKSMYCCVLCECQRYSTSVGRESPLWALRREFFQWAKNSVKLVVLLSYQKHVKNFFIVSIFMALYLCEKEESCDNSMCVRKNVIRCALCRSVEVAALSLVEKILSEYLNNRILLIGFKTWFCS